MTDIEFALLTFGLIIATLVVIILACVIIFKFKKRRCKTLSQEEFDKKLFNNKKMIIAEDELSKTVIKNNKTDF